MYAIRIGKLYYSESDPTRWTGKITEAYGFKTAEDAAKVLDGWVKRNATLGGQKTTKADIEALDVEEGAGIDLVAPYTTLLAELEKTQKALEASQAENKDLKRSLFKVSAALTSVQEHLK